MRDISVGKPEGERPLWRGGRRWEDNIKVELKKIFLISLK
jgi:hypothetical protein